MNTPASASLVTARYALLLLSCATALFYFQWRLGVMNPSFLAYAWIVFAAEIVGFVRSLMFSALGRARAAPRNAGRASGAYR